MVDHLGTKQISKNAKNPEELRNPPTWNECLSPMRGIPDTQDSERLGPLHWSNDCKNHPNAMKSQNSCSKTQLHLFTLILFFHGTQDWKNVEVWYMNYIDHSTADLGVHCPLFFQLPLQVRLFLDSVHPFGTTPQLVRPWIDHDCSQFLTTCLLYKATFCAKDPHHFAEACLKSWYQQRNLVDVILSYPPI